MNGEPQRHRSRVLVHWIGGTLLIGAIGLLASGFDLAMLFPPLGATAFLLLHRPEAPPASPRCTVYGHAIAMLVGAAAHSVCGCDVLPAAALAQMDFGHAAAAALALGGTAALMELLNAPHPPAGATTVVVALGQLRGYDQLLVALGAVVVLVVLGGGLARLQGIQYPLWRA